MSFTRLAGARSAPAFLAWSVRPSRSSNTKASALSVGGRTVFWATAAGGDATATRRSESSRRVTCTLAPILATCGSGRQGKGSANRALEILGGLEARRATADGGRLARARIAD